MKNALLSFLLLIGFQSAAQTDSLSGSGQLMFHQDRYISILTGYNGWQNHYAELGVAYNMNAINSHHPASWAMFASAEIRPGRTTIVGTKVGAWAGGGCAGMALGFNAIWYTNGNDNTLRLRPEIGMGFGPFKVVYGYNIPFFNRNFEGVNTHNISAAFLIGVKHLKNSSSPTP